MPSAGEHIIEQLADLWTFRPGHDELRLFVGTALVSQNNQLGNRIEKPWDREAPRAAIQATDRRLFFLSYDFAS